MKKFIITLLNTYFLNTLYGKLTPEKLRTFTSNTFLVKEEKKTNDCATIRVNDTLIIYMYLTPHGYVKKIDVEEI